MRHIILAAALVLAGSAAHAGVFDQFGDKAKQVQPGMSEAQVTQLLGRSDGFKTAAGCRTLTYNNRRVALFGDFVADYTVVLCGDQVTEVDQTSPRNPYPNAGTLLIVPLGR